MATWFVPLLFDILLINALRCYLLLMPIRLTPTCCPTGRVCKSKTAKGCGRMGDKYHIRSAIPDNILSRWVKNL